MADGIEQRVAKVMLLGKLSTGLGCVKEERKEDKKDLFNLDEITTDKLDTESKKHISMLGGMSLNGEYKDKHLIVLDG